MQRDEVIEWKFAKNGNYARVIYACSIKIIRIWLIWRRISQAFQRCLKNLSSLIFHQVTNFLRRSCFEYDFCKWTQNFERYCRCTDCIESSRFRYRLLYHQNQRWLDFLPMHVFVCRHSSRNCYGNYVFTLKR